jgi:hypothetical protein
MKEEQLRAEVVKRRKQLKRPEGGEVPERTWRFMDEMGWVHEATEMFDDEAVEYLVGYLDKLDAVAPSSRARHVLGRQHLEEGLAEGSEGPNRVEEGEEYFEVELGDYERERQRAFAEVMAREVSENEQVVGFRQDYLGGRVLTPDQAHALLESPAARYFVIELFLELKIPAAEHRAEILGRYERLRDAPDDVDHRVTISVDPPGVTRKVRYARHEAPVTDSDQIDVQHCAFKDSEHTVMKMPDEVLLRYRDRDGVRQVTHIWPESVLDELRHRSRMVARMYGWEEEDVVWFFLTGDAPELNALRLNVRFTAGNLPTITITAAPWVSAETIKKNAHKVQSQVLLKGNYALSLRSIAVLRFVERNIRERGKRPPWPELKEGWNQERPEWRYQSYRGLRQTYYRTLEAVVYAPISLPRS